MCQGNQRRPVWQETSTGTKQDLDRTRLPLPDLRAVLRTWPSVLEQKEDVDLLEPRATFYPASELILNEAG